jgi:hypothetical protein
MKRSTFKKAAKLNPNSIRRLAKYLGIRSAYSAHINWVAHLCFKFTKIDRNGFYY